MHNTILVSGNTVAVLCPQRHVIVAMPLREWAGSAIEANYHTLQCRL